MKIDKFVKLLMPKVSFQIQTQIEKKIVNWN